MNDIKALIVEDDFIIKMFLEQLITGKGCEVISTYDSGEALLSDIANVEPSLIFMDISLSGELNGIEVASALKENNKIPIVFVTGNKDILDGVDLKKHNVIHIINKPITEVGFNLEYEVILKKISTL